MFLFLFGAALLGAPDAVPAESADKPKAEKKVCRRVETVGSRMSKRVCTTEAQPSESRQSSTSADPKPQADR